MTRSIIETKKNSPKRPTNSYFNNHKYSSTNYRSNISQDNTSNHPILHYVVSQLKPRTEEQPGSAFIPLFRPVTLQYPRAGSGARYEKLSPNHARIGNKRMELAPIVGRWKLAGKKNPPRRVIKRLSGVSAFACSLFATPSTGRLRLWELTPWPEPFEIIDHPESSRGRFFCRRNN